MTLRQAQGKLAKPVLEISGLTKRFKDVTAVDNISFSVREGEIVGLLGPNGAGKTTTIQMLLGLVTPDAGSIKFFGKDLGAHKSEILRQINFSSAYVELPHSLTVWENLNVFANIYNVDDSQKRIEELLQIFQISHLRNKLVRNLSTGQKTRVLLCKALLNKPRLVLFDEPMASLDPDIVDQTLNFLLELKKKEKLTILYTSHNMWEVERICDRVIFINHGKIVDQGTPLELTQKVLELEAIEPNLADVFIRIARMKG